MAVPSTGSAKDDTEFTVERTAGSPTRLNDVLPDLGKPWWRVPYLVKLNIGLVVPLVTSYISGFDGSMLNGMQSLPVWNADYDHPSGANLGLVSAMQLIGGVIALPLAPYACDRWGRRHPIFFGAILIIIGAVLMGAGSTIGTFLGGRFLIGMGNAFTATAAAPLVAELAYPTQRPIISALYNTSWYLGSIVAAWITYGTFKIDNSWSWRIPCLLQIFGPLIQVIFVYFTPESPRWLVATDQPDKAEQVLSWAHAGSATPNELVLYEMSEITIAIQNEKIQNTASYADFFKTPGNRHRFFITAILGLIIQWCGNGLITLYLIQVLNNIGITDGETQNVINGVLQIFNYIVSLAAAFCVDSFGRRRLFLVSTGGMLLSFIIWTAISAVNEQQNLENKGLGIGIVVMIFIFFFFYNVAMNPVPIAYMMEILPFTLRAKGITVFNTFQFGSSIFNAFANPIALQAIGWRYYIVFVCATVGWFIIFYFFFPETKGKSLEEVAIIFDGEASMEVHPKDQVEEERIEG